MENAWNMPKENQCANEWYSECQNWVGDDFKPFMWKIWFRLVWRFKNNLKVSKLFKQVCFKCLSFKQHWHFFFQRNACLSNGYFFFLFIRLRASSSVIKRCHRVVFERHHWNLERLNSWLLTAIQGLLFSQDYQVRVLLRFYLKNLFKSTIDFNTSWRLKFCFLLQLLSKSLKFKCKNYYIYTNSISRQSLKQIQDCFMSNMHSADLWSEDFGIS